MLVELQCFFIFLFILFYSTSIIFEKARIHTLTMISQGREMLKWKSEIATIIAMGEINKWARLGSQLEDSVDNVVVVVLQSVHRFTA